MEMLSRSTKDTTSKKTVPSMKAFIDDVAVISESKSHMEKLLKRLQELFKWAVMKIKPSKSRSLSTIKGKCQEIKFAIDNNVILTIRKNKSVKNLFPSTYWSSPVARSFKTIKRWITLHW